MKKKILFITFLILLIPFGFVLGRETEVTYPIVPGAIRPVTTRVLFTDYIKYAYNSIIVFSGLICFGTMIWAGSVYATSAGNPTKQKDARNRVLLAFIGSLIVLGSYLMANTINPQLINPSIGITPVGGITLYSDVGCGGEGRNFNADSSDFGLMPDGESEFTAQSLKFVSEAGDLQVVLYADKEFKGHKIIADSQIGDLCFNNLGGEKKSIQFKWQLPGIYFCTQTYNGTICDGTERYLGSDIAFLPEEIRGDVKGLKILNKEDPVNNGSFSVVLHQNENQEGMCLPIIGNVNVKVSTTDISSFPFLSATVFLKDLPRGHSDEEGVYLCEEANFGDPCTKSLANNDLSVEEINSVKIEGDFIAILKGSNHGRYERCKVFRQSDSNLLDNPIGRCGCVAGNWQCKSCVEKAIIYDIKK